jgi:hypothetical protein
MKQEQLINDHAILDNNLVAVWKNQIQSNPFMWKNFFEQSTEERQHAFFSWFEGLDLATQERVVRSTLGATANVSYEDLNQEQEFKYLKQFLFRYKLSAVNEEVCSRISSDDFIEVYDSQGIQIYRSWNFFKFCRYTIDQVLTKSWGELYERPEFVEKKLLSLMPKLFQGDCDILEYNIQDFILSERYLKPSNKYLVKMKFACPLKDVSTHQVVAFISVAQAKRLDN